MQRKLLAILISGVMAAGAFAPAAQAYERRHDHSYNSDGYCSHDGYYDRDFDRGYNRDYGRRDYGRDYDRRRQNYNYGRGRDDNDDDEAIAAGVIGLVLGLALGAAASQPQRPRNAYDSQGYDRNYYGAAAPAYPQRPACTRRERQWDRYANRTVTVDVPC